MDYAIDVLQHRKSGLLSELQQKQNKVGVLVFFGEDTEYIQEAREELEDIQHRIDSLDSAVAVLREAK
ncbi:Hypothetical Protein OBI_RACECAR_219 [Arthrobacter phage Racecar]|nr:hypothetical protein PBI_RACECAR_11 [Arthrobacter phage Racecar]QFG12696.1 hypothetical protein PBI_MIMI_11 [Arthrobacter phage Mimi]